MKKRCGWLGDEAGKTIRQVSRDKGSGLGGARR